MSKRIKGFYCIGFLAALSFASCADFPENDGLSADYAENKLKTSAATVSDIEIPVVAIEDTKVIVQDDILPEVEIAPNAGAYYPTNGFLQEAYNAPSPWLANQNYDVLPSRLTDDRFLFWTQKISSTDVFKGSPYDPFTGKRFRHH